MKKKLIPVAFKTFFLFLSFAVIFGFSNRKTILSENQFRENIGSIINEKGISQTDLAKTMLEAELRKSGSETASEYITNYMNKHFKAAFGTENRVSIARPGQPDLRQTVTCNLTALQTHTGNAIGYYYAYALRCDGTYKYDGKNYTGGSTVYVRAEASVYVLEAFILF